ncbi:MAG TPA: hypothetical protein V6D17_24220 [Candidatus Obscuribacterales bacterium]
MVKAIEKWQAITQAPPIVEFLSGLFDSVGVRVVDTGEEFTCTHTGDRITFAPGIDPGVDYAVEIQSLQIDRLSSNAKSGAFDEAEKYRIISTLFTPATKASLKNPIFSNRIVRRLAGAEDLIHVYLQSPVKEEQDVTHTLIFARGQWLVFPGLHGKPGRVYRLTMEQARAYQRQALAAMTAKRWLDLLNFTSWYKEWRKGVSARA